jgi:hypothetical protein
LKTAPVLALLALAGASTLAAPPTSTAFERTETRSPCAVFDPMRRPHFGDLHVHTRYSLDASTQGTRTTPAQAYDFARGKPLGIQPWNADGTPARSVRIDRPLDFAAVTDHAEFFGETTICNTPGLAGHDSLMCRVYRGWPRLAFFLMNGRGPQFALCGDDQRGCREADALPWADMRDAAEAAYDRTPACTFTTFIGYEWTGYTHRNVIFRNAEVPPFAPSKIEYPHETDLWDVLDDICRGDLPACDFVVIPHNSNISKSTTFQTVNPEGTAFSVADARRRAANETLVEIMQHKGSSECFTGAGTADELCGFENVPYDDLAARFVTWMKKDPAADNFTRTALGIGLLEHQRIGANPFAFGVIGSSDTHLGTPGLVAEAAYPGHGGAGIPLGESLPDALLDPIEYNPGGLAVLWAEENSRDALFAAMQRREAYATSGPRIVFRLFGGWDYPVDLCERADFAAVGYAAGVPMGGDLPRPPSPGAPVFAAQALKDGGSRGADGIPLQRLQIIKLWVEDGVVRERIADIAGTPDSTANVDTDTCIASTTGADDLCAVWRDPEFDAAAPAVYYGRVIEDPTCRWSTRACNEAGIRCDRPATVRRGWEDCCDPAYPRTIQERAWTSPIWYKPSAPPDR